MFKNWCSVFDLVSLCVVPDNIRFAEHWPDAITSRTMLATKHNPQYPAD